MTSGIKEAAEKSKVYLCKACGFSLVPNPLYKQQINPYGGTGYYCETCHTTYDISVDKLEYKLRSVSASVPKKDEGKPMIMFLNENKGTTPKGRSYDTVNPEPFEDEFYKSQGMEIVDSTVEINGITYKKNIKPDRYFRPVTQLD